jgi:phage-related minor tail protein
MSKRIEGITLKIGADTTELNKAIKGIDSELRSTQSQLRDVNRLLKLDPGNTQLLQQKQRLLGEAIGETKTKLEQLKEAQEKASEALANGEINQNQYDALQREIIETEANLKKLEQQAEETTKALQDPSMFDNIGKAGQKLQEIGDKVSTVGKGLTKGVTAPIIAMGAASVKAFNEVDAGIDTIVAKTGASGQALDKMTASMENIATRIPTDFETAGAAVGEVNTRFGLTGQALEDLSEKFVKFAELNGTDVSSAVDQTQKVMEAFGVKTEDAGAMLDTLNAVGQSTGISMDTLTSAMVTNSAALNEMGLSASDSAYFIGNLEKSGIDTSQAMTGLKKATVEAAKEGKTLPDVLRGFSETMNSTKSDTEKLQEAIDIFGSKAGPAIYQAMKTGTLSLDELGTSLQDNLGNLDKTYEGTLDGTDKLKTTFNELKIAGAELGGAIGDTLAPILESLAGVIRKVAKWFENLDPKTKEMIVKIGLLAAAIGPVVFVVGKVISVIGTVMSLISTIGPIIAGLTGPIGLVVAAIAGAIAVGVLLYQHWDEIKAKASEVWEGIKNIILGVFEFFKGIPERWSALWEGLKNVFIGFWTSLMENPIIQLFLQLITDELGIFTGTLSGIWENIRQIASTAWELIKTAILGPVALIVDLVTGDFGKLRDDAKDIWSNIRDLSAQLWEEIKTLITDFASDIWNGVKDTFGNLRDNISDIWNSVKDTASRMWQGIKSTVESWANSAKDSAVNAFNNVVTGISNALSGLYGVVSDAFSGAVDAIEDFVDDAWDWGYDMMVNFAEGIANGVTWVWDEVWDLVDWIEDMIGFSEPDKGPLSRFHTYGPDMMKLLASGIKDNAYLVQDAIGDVAGVLSGSVQGATPETNNYSYGPMSINVYGAEGQDVRELARIVEERISDNMRRTGAVFR